MEPTPEELAEIEECLAPSRALKGHDTLRYFYWLFQDMVYAKKTTAAVKAGLVNSTEWTNCAKEHEALLMTTDELDNVIGSRAPAADRQLQVPAAADR